MIRQREADERHRIRLWGWKDEGKKTFHNVKEAFKSVEYILRPHQNKHNYILHFEEMFNNIFHSPSTTKSYHTASYLILDYIMCYNKRNKCIYRLLKNHKNNILSSYI